MRLSLRIRDQKSREADSADSVDHKILPNLTEQVQSDDLSNDMKQNISSHQATGNTPSVQNPFIDPAFEMHDSGDWTCLKCNADFSQNDSVGRHLFTCLNLKSFNFNHVKQSEITGSSSETSGSPSPFRCLICSKTFTRHSGLVIHHKAIHLGHRPFQCTRCGYRFKKNQDLRTHILANSKLRLRSLSFACKICEAKFSSTCNLGRHLRDVHGKSSYSYRPANPNTTKTKLPKIEQGQKKESAYESSESSSSCSICSKVLPSFEALKSHLGNVHRQKNIECQFCSSKFTNKTRLRNHLFIHADLKSFACKLCDFKCNNPSNFQRHGRLMHGKYFAVHSEFLREATKATMEALAARRTSKNIAQPRKSRLSVKNSPDSSLSNPGDTNCNKSSRQLKCTHCTATFQFRHLLKRHAAVHTNKLTHPCSSCGVRFSFLSNLYRHKKTAHGLDSDSVLNKADTKQESSHLTKLSCKICFKVLKTIDALKYHLGRVHGQKIYGCQFCSAKFTTKTTLTHHLFIHSDLKPFACKLCDFKCNNPYNFQRHGRLIHGKVVSVSTAFLREATNATMNALAARRKTKKIPSGKKPRLRVKSKADSNQSKSSEATRNKISRRS